MEDEKIIMFEPPIMSEADMLDAGLKFTPNITEAKTYWIEPEVDKGEEI